MGYYAAARRGLRLFADGGNYAFCHFGPALTNGEFADADMPHFVGPGRVDPGRHGGIRKLRESNFGEFRVGGVPPRRLFKASADRRPVGA